MESPIIQLLQYVPERFADQCVIIGDEDFHGYGPLSRAGLYVFIGSTTK